VKRNFIHADHASHHVEEEPIRKEAREQKDKKSKDQPADPTTSRKDD
jgi:hypothetical protein